ncbi:hypothetical protein GBA65_01390 [Rubrobacter marinus]|uniref:SPW repeat-containing integral membrane domain-containing protein n=1 Tax=Rubrobacter marinus TaxID=2653852 RepID=A0A6G8Q291_9ACTN|nr:hypothetical protein GBA65_01390 [Rubrobacter marinus]
MNPPRVIPTSVHGVLDYAASGFNLAVPSIMGLKDSPAASRMPRIVGGAGTVYSLLTDYELGLVRRIPMPVHLALDAAKGALLASSPWLFGFAGKGTRYWLPHVALGTADVLAALTSRKYPS